MSVPSHHMPRVVIAAPASGHGKTSVATGMLAAFAARGCEVSAHKVGPDYIDPSYHSLAAGRPGRNLDPWLVGEERIAPLFIHGALAPRRADIAIIEGVMGLFDGASGRRGFASTAHVATLLDAPVLMVVDASAQARSIAALLHGFATFDPRVRLAGVILNRVGSEGHERVLREAIDSLGIPVVGAIRRDDRLVTPSRHLGLVPAAERIGEAQRGVADLGAAIAASVDLDAVEAIARSAPSISAHRWDPHDELGEIDMRMTSPLVCVAGGSAFTFGYPEHLELLRAAGAETTVIDPLRDEHLPDGTAALVIGGGFPELHASTLSDNSRLRSEVAALAHRGAPIAAECAGLLYLARSLDGLAMCGVLPTEATMSEHLTLGYREAVAQSRSVLTDVEARVRGHEFHRTVCQPDSGIHPAWRWPSKAAEGFVQNRVHASYLHLHWAGNPGIASRFVESVRDAMPHRARHESVLEAIYLAVRKEFT